MAVDRGRIQHLVMSMQQAFLDAPWLGLTLPQAQRQFDVDALTCKAVLDALVTSGVLMTTAQGRYVRFYPRLAHVAAA